MAVTDPIADMLTRIRNAIGAGHNSVNIPASKMKVSLAKILKTEGFVEDFELSENEDLQANIIIQLHYLDDGSPGISGLKRVSRPGLRTYVRKGEIPRYYGGMGLPIMSTSKGVMTGKQAWREQIGGELLCYVW